MHVDQETVQTTQPPKSGSKTANRQAIFVNKARARMQFIGKMPSSNLANGTNKWPATPDTKVAAII